MAKIKMLHSTGNGKLSREATVIIKKGRKPLTDAEKQPDVRFIRVAGIRLAKMLKLSKGLRACANTSVYKYSDEQVERIFKLLRNSIDRTEAAFAEAKMAKSGTVVRKMSKLENPLA